MEGGIRKRKKSWKKENEGFPPWKRSFAHMDGWMVALYINNLKTPKDDLFFFPTIRKHLIIIPYSLSF